MTHSPTGKYRARCVPKSPNPSLLRKKSFFQCFSVGGGFRAACGRITNSVEACGPVLFGTARFEWVDPRPARGGIPP